MLKFTLHKWAADMLHVVKSVDPKLAKELPRSFTEGVEIKASVGRRLLEAFEAWKPFDELDNYWIIESLQDPDVGIIVDLREEPKSCLVSFYENEK